MKVTGKSVSCTMIAAQEFFVAGCATADPCCAPPAPRHPKRFLSAASQQKSSVLLPSTRLYFGPRLLWNFCLFRNHRKTDLFARRRGELNSNMTTIQVLSETCIGVSGGPLEAGLARTRAANLMVGIATWGPPASIGLPGPLWVRGTFLNSLRYWRDFGSTGSRMFSGIFFQRWILKTSN